MRRGATAFGRSLLLAALLALTACAPAQPPRYTVFAMEGPPLAIVGGRLDDAGEPSLAGRMERSAMVGDGDIEIDYPSQNLACRGRLKGGPAGNGRVRGIIPCTGGDEPLFLLLTLGQHGPDQGAGVARLARGKVSAFDGAGGESELAQVEDLDISEEPPLLFFYHPWDEEAVRRYQDARSNVLRGLEKKNEGKAD